MKVLIVIDAQEDFVRGPLGTQEAIEALPVIHKIVHHMDELNNLVLFTKDTHGDDYFDTQEGKLLPVKHCIRNTHGWEICPEATDGKKHYVDIEKSSFGFTKWKEWFTFDENVEFYLCGFCTDICVMANFQILKALCPENPIFIIEDACAGVTPELHEAALEVMKSCQAYVISSREFEVKLLTDKPVDSKKTVHHNDTIMNDENDKPYDHLYDMYIDEFEDAEDHTKDKNTTDIVEWEDEWYGTVIMCKTCETNFMMGNDDDLNYCPHCGRYLRVKTKSDE